MDRPRCVNPTAVEYDVAGPSGEALYYGFSGRDERVQLKMGIELKLKRRPQNPAFFGKCCKQTGRLLELHEEF